MSEPEDDVVELEVEDCDAFYRIVEGEATDDNVSKDYSSHDNTSKDNTSHDNTSNGNASNDKTSNDNASHDNTSNDNVSNASEHPEGMPTLKYYVEMTEAELLYGFLCLMDKLYGNVDSLTFNRTQVNISIALKMLKELRYINLLIYHERFLYIEGEKILKILHFATIHSRLLSLSKHPLFLQSTPSKVSKHCKRVKEMISGLKAVAAKPLDTKNLLRLMPNKCNVLNNISLHPYFAKEQIPLVQDLTTFERTTFGRNATSQSHHQLQPTVPPITRRPVHDRLNTPPSSSSQSYRRPNSSQSSFDSSVTEAFQSKTSKETVSSSAMPYRTPTEPKNIQVLHEHLQDPSTNRFLNDQISIPSQSSDATSSSNQVLVKVCLRIPQDVTQEEKTLIVKFAYLISSALKHNNELNPEKFNPETTRMFQTLISELFDVNRKLFYERWRHTSLEDVATLKTFHLHQVNRLIFIYGQKQMDRISNLSNCDFNKSRQQVERSLKVLRELVNLSPSLLLPKLTEPREGDPQRQSKNESFDPSDPGDLLSNNSTQNPRNENQQKECPMNFSLDMSKLLSDKIYCDIPLKVLDDASPEEMDWIFKLDTLLACLEVHGRDLNAKGLAHTNKDMFEKLLHDLKLINVTIYHTRWCHSSEREEEKLVRHYLNYAKKIIDALAADQMSLCEIPCTVRDIRDQSQKILLNIYNLRCLYNAPWITRYSKLSEPRKVTLFQNPSLKKILFEEMKLSEENSKLWNVIDQVSPTLKLGNRQNSLANSMRAKRLHENVSSPLIQSEPSQSFYEGLYSEYKSNRGAASSTEEVQSKLSDKQLNSSSAPVSQNYICTQVDPPMEKDLISQFENLTTQIELQARKMNPSELGRQDKAKIFEEVINELKFYNMMIYHERWRHVVDGSMIQKKSFHNFHKIQISIRSLSRMLFSHYDGQHDSYLLFQYENVFELTKQLRNLINFKLISWMPNLAEPKTENPFQNDSLMTFFQKELGQPTSGDVVQEPLMASASQNETKTSHIKKSLVNKETTQSVAQPSNEEKKWIEKFEHTLAAYESLAKDLNPRGLAATGSETFQRLQRELGFFNAVIFHERWIFASPADKIELQAYHLAVIKSRILMLGQMQEYLSHPSSKAEKKPAKMLRVYDMINVLREKINSPPVLKQNRLLKPKKLILLQNPCLEKYFKKEQKYIDGLLLLLKSNDNNQELDDAGHESTPSQTKISKYSSDIECVFENLSNKQDQLSSQHSKGLPAVSNAARSTDLKRPSVPIESRSGQKIQGPPAKKAVKMPTSYDTRRNVRSDEKSRKTSRSPLRSSRSHSGRDSGSRSQIRDSRSTDSRRQDQRSRRHNRHSRSRSRSRSRNGSRRRRSRSRNRNSGTRTETSKRSQGSRVLADDLECICCKSQSHDLQSCPKFKRLPLTGRWDIITNYTYTICTFCLETGHHSRNCSKDTLCTNHLCAQRYHKRLHLCQEQSKQDTNDKDEPNVELPSCICCHKIRHELKDCQKFVNMQKVDRQKIFEKLKVEICKVCLGYDHLEVECSLDLKCQVTPDCMARAHPLIHTCTKKSIKDRLTLTEAQPPIHPQRSENSQKPVNTRRRNDDIVPGRQKPVNTRGRNDDIAPGRQKPVKTNVPGRRSNLKTDAHEMRKRPSSIPSSGQGQNNKPSKPNKIARYVDENPTKTIEMFREETRREIERQMQMLMQGKELQSPNFRDDEATKEKKQEKIEEKSKYLAIDCDDKIQSRKSENSREQHRTPPDQDKSSVQVNQAKSNSRQVEKESFRNPISNNRPVTLNSVPDQQRHRRYPESRIESLCRELPITIEEKPKSVERYREESRQDIERKMKMLVEGKPLELEEIQSQMPQLVPNRILAKAPLRHWSELCSVCQSKSHLTNECPQNFCTACQDFGHQLKNCKAPVKPRTERLFERSSQINVIDYQHTLPPVPQPPAISTMTSSTLFTQIARPQISSYPKQVIDYSVLPQAQTVKRKYSGGLWSHFDKIVRARGFSSEIANNMMAFWELVGHSETSLKNLVRNQPVSQSRLRLLLVAEIAKSPNKGYPDGFSIDGLVDETIQYLLPLSSDESIEDNFTSLRPLREFIVSKIRAMSVMFGITEDYIARVSSGIVESVSHAGFGISSLQHHIEAKGKDHLAAMLTERLSASTAKLPQGVTPQYAVNMVTDFFSFNLNN